MESSDDTKKNFFTHVFSMDDASKSDLLNVIQYALLAIIPVVVLNKSMQKFVPEVDEQKGSLEILAEIVIQVITMFIGLIIIHRMITFVPTYSNVKYPEYSVLFIVLAVLMITMSLQTKLGEKVSVIVDRISDLWNGTSSNTKNVKGKNGKNANVKVSQPISGNGQVSNQSAMNQSMYSDGTSINTLPMNTVSSQNVGTQQLPDYNNMYRQDTTPLVGAATPGGGGQEGFMNEPMAASEFGSYGGFSSW
jgi:hypothetical protein